MKKIRIDYYFLAIIIYYIFYSFYGETVTVNNGFGWDGIKYANFARDFWSEKLVSDYTVGRLLPSFLIYYTAKILKISCFSPKEIIGAFHIYNSTLLLLSYLFWKKIAEACSFFPLTTQLGFFFLFINCAFFKQTLFCACQTDVTAFFFGILLLFIVIKFYHWMFFPLSLLLASLSWPIAGYFGGLLYLAQDAKKNPNPSKANNFIFCAIIILIFCLVFYKLCYVSFNISQLFNVLIVCIFIGYVSWQAYFLSYVPLLPKNFLKKILSYTLFLLLNYCILHLLIVKFNAKPSGLGVEWFITVTIASAIKKPFLFIIAHSIYFGPAILLVGFFFKQILKESVKKNYGLYLFFLATLIISLNSESRMLSFNYPIIVFCLCLALNNFGLTKRFSYIISGLCILSSKFYVPFNIDPWSVTTEAYDSVFWEFPYQFLFMNIGPNMTWQTYFINFFIALTMGVIIYYELEILKNTNSINNKKILKQ